MEVLRRIEDIARKAVSDPGSICARRQDEGLPGWQAHAVVTALDCRGHLRERGDNHAVLRQLAALRRQRGMSQRQVAEALGTTQSAISELETGTVSPTLDMLARYAGCLGMNVVLTPIAEGG